MLLLIPGPVTTARAVRDAAAQDYAPWDNEFRALAARLSERVLALAGGRPGEHIALPLQGCGHFAMEGACRTFVPPGGRILVPKTGQYADRLQRLATECGRVVVPLDVAEDMPLDLERLRAALIADGSISHVALVYSETSTGIVHDVPGAAAIVAECGRRVLVDAISAFGALPLDIGAMPAVDCVSFTANKCLEGLPGLAFSVARLDRLEACAGQAQSWSFDLSDLAAHYRKGPGAFRFTPAAGTLPALMVALDLLEAEGGTAARLARYHSNMVAIYDGVQQFGLSPYLRREVQGPVVVNVRAPDGPGWNLQRFVDGLKRHGVLISNFDNTPRPSFRVGCIGAVTPDDMRGAVRAMGSVLAEMGVRRPRAA